MIEQTITVGNIIEIGVIVGGIAAGLGAMRATLKNMRAEVTKWKKDVHDDLRELKSELKSINSIITDNAVINKRLEHLEDAVDELRHGDGFVQGRRGVDREYGP